MKKTTKGVLAASAAGALLLGGAGSLAFWTDSQSVGGDSIASGHMSLDAANCSGWTLDTGETVADASGKLVPGDVLTNDCTYTINAVGTHLRAGLTVTDSSATGALASYFTVDPSVVTVGGVAAGTEITSADNGKTLEVVIKATFNGGSGNTSQDLTGSLNGITVSLQQDHS